MFSEEPTLSYQSVGYVYTQDAFIRSCWCPLGAAVIVRAFNNPGRDQALNYIASTIFQCLDCPQGNLSKNVGTLAVSAVAFSQYLLLIGYNGV